MKTYQTFPPQIVYLYFIWNYQNWEKSLFEMINNVCEFILLPIKLIYEMNNLIKMTYQMNNVSPWTFFNFHIIYSLLKYKGELQ